MHDVKAFGAVGDGVAKDTAAIQRAIDAGGMVHFPPGTYLSGTLYLKSRGGLELSPGAVLLASPDRQDYNADDFCPQNRVFASERVSGAHFIVAVEQENIVIRGGGRIDGNRAAFYSEYHAPDRDFVVTGWRPGQMLFLCECNGVTIADVEMFNAPYWTCFLHGCEEVQLRGLRIWNDQRTPNGDGIDLDCCRKVAVSDCLIDSGDDCITLRACPEPLKRPRPCAHVAITNCVLRTCCNAFRVGVGNGVIHDCVIDNIVIHGTRTAICVVSNYLGDPTTGVEIKNLAFRNLTIDAHRALIILSNVQGARTTPAAKMIHGLHFSGLYGRVAEPMLISGNVGGGVRNITLSDVILEYEADPRPVDPDPAGIFCEWNQRSPAALAHVAYAEDILFDRVAMRDLDPASQKRYAIQTHAVKNVRCEGCRFDKPVGGEHGA